MSPTHGAADQKPPLVQPEEQDSFDTTKPFKVSDRLDYLAKKIAGAAPFWVPSTNRPAVSKSHKTAHYIDIPDCSVKQLQEPVPELSAEVLQVEIDFRPGSPLRKLIAGNNPRYSHLRSCISQDIIAPQMNPCPDTDENDYTTIVQGSLRTAVALATVLLLQLWFDDSNDNSDETEGRDALSILIQLDSQSSLHDPDCTPDHTIQGPATAAIGHAMRNWNICAVSMLDRKAKSFTEYAFRDDWFDHPSFTSSTKDNLIDDIIADGRAFCDIRNIFITGHPDVKGKPYQGGWRVATLHLLGQMKTQCTKAGSKMAFFTSVYAFNRVSLVENEQLYVSKSLTAFLQGAQDRSTWETGKPFVNNLLLFVVARIAKAYPDCIPPKRRERYRTLFRPTLTASP